MFLRLCDLSPCPSRAWAGTSTRIELRISGGNVRVFGSIPVGSSGQRAAAGLQVLDQRIIGPFLLQQYRKHIEPGSMAPCSSNQRLNEATHVQQFLAVTGDKDAIDNSTATFRCWNDVFVLGPGCRDAVTKCVPYLTYASWMMQAAIQRIFVYKLSLAYGELWSRRVYTQTPCNHRVVMYYWFPGYVFAELSPPMLTWMPYNASQWGNGIMTSEAATGMVGTYVSPVIREGYEDIYDLASNMDLLPEQMHDLLAGTKAAADSGMPVAEALAVAARSWLSKNTEVILAWLPNSTAEESITLTCGSHVNGSSNRSYVFCPGRLASEVVISTCGSTADTALQIHGKRCDDCGHCGAKLR